MDSPRGEAVLIMGQDKPSRHISDGAPAAPADNPRSSAMIDPGQQAYPILEADELLKTRALDVANEGIVITDFTRPDNPVIYVNAGFQRITGYGFDDVAGRNCRFLQGPETDAATAEAIRKAIRREIPVTVEILNYRKDGGSFWNRLSITPVRDGEGRTTHFIGVQSDVTGRRQAEDSLRQTTERLEEATTRMRRDLEAAARVQQALLPRALPVCECAQLAWSFRPSAELAGDTLNIVGLGDHRLGLYVLDVSGHGVPAALLSVTLSRWLSPIADRSCLFEADPGSESGYRLAAPAAVASRLNEQFPLDHRTGQFFTLLYGILDTESRQLTYVTAGHPPPLLLRGEGSVRSLPACGFPIGVAKEPRYEDRSVELEVGDRLFLYTDGLLEARNEDGETFGTERLAQAIVETAGQDLDEALGEFVARVEAFAWPRALDDDVTLLALQMLARAH